MKSLNLHRSLGGGFAFICTLGFAQQPSSIPPAASSQGVPVVESCSIDPKPFAAIAARRGYVSNATSTEGDAVCVIDEVNVILVVSATAKANAKCDFQLFVPPTQKKLGVMRIGLKSGPGENTRYIQRPASQAKGIWFALDSPKGVTRQFRIVSVEVEPLNGGCPATVVDGALP